MFGVFLEGRWCFTWSPLSGGSLLLAVVIGLAVVVLVPLFISARPLSRPPPWARIEADGLSHGPLDSRPLVDAVVVVVGLAPAGKSRLLGCCRWSVSHVVVEGMMCCSEVARSLFHGADEEVCGTAGRSFGR